jgi:hypothetical protein
MSKRQIEALINLGFTGPAYEDADGNLVFQDDTPRPSDEEIRKEAERLVQLDKEKEYQLKRVKEYPKLSVLADALFHQANGNDAPMQAYLEAVQAVKDKYPKQ